VVHRNLLELAQRNPPIRGAIRCAIAPYPARRVRKL